MRQKIFQIARDLSIDSKLIIRKLTREDLPPPGGQSENGSAWTSRSPVSVGLREMIREWHASGELAQLAAEPSDRVAPRRGRKPRAETSAARGAERGTLPALEEGGSYARQAMEALARIDRDARQKKREQLDGLRESRAAIEREIKGLHRQIGQIDEALAAIAGRPAASVQAPRVHRDLSALREQMGAWLESRRGEKFGAGALATEFPDLGDTAVSYILKPLVESGRLQTDASAGSKRPKYFAP